MTWESIVLHIGSMFLAICFIETIVHYLHKWIIDYASPDDNSPDNK